MIKYPGPGYCRKLSPSQAYGACREPGKSCDCRETQLESELQQPGGEVVVQSLSRVQLLASPWTAASQASLSFTVSWSFLKFMSIELIFFFSFNAFNIFCHSLVACSVSVEKSADSLWEFS